MADNDRCWYCGSDAGFEIRKIDYLYKHQHRGEYLLVPNTPVEMCRNCHGIYYPAKVLLAIEQMFLAIREGTATPDTYIQVPVADYETITARSNEAASAPLLAS